jgi:lysophospholipase L1-like esterase
MIAKALGRLALFGFSLALSVLTIEIASRFLFLQWAPIGGDRIFWDYDETLGWSHRPGQRGRFEYEDFSVEVAINSVGLRDTEYSLKRVPGKKRMLLLGDSLTWGFGVEQNESFGEVLEQRHPDWEIINGGVSGYGTDQEYLYYTTQGAAYKPDVVLTLFSGNDPENSFHPVQYWHNKPVFRPSGDGIELTNVPVPQETLAQRLANYIAKNTYFLRTASHMIAQIMRDSSKAQVFDAETQGGPSAHSRDSAASAATPSDPLTIAKDDLVVRILLALNDATRENGAQLIVIASTVGGPASNSVFIDPRFVEAEIPYLSLTSSFEGAVHPFHFEHDSHWTPYGHSLVADSIERFLIGLGVFEGPDESERPSAG